MSRFSGPQGKGAMREYRAQTRARVEKKEAFWRAIDAYDWDTAESILYEMGNPSYMTRFVEEQRKAYELPAELLLKTIFGDESDD